MTNIAGISNGHTICVLLGSGYAESVSEAEMKVGDVRIERIWLQYRYTTGFGKVLACFKDLGILIGDPAV